MKPRRERVAAIDVGSNTILFTVAEYDPSRGLVVIDEGEDQPRLGAGLASTGRLSEAAMQRALDALGRVRETCRRHGVQRISAAATAAVREAANGTEFVERVRALDIPLRVISPETEAALSYRSAAYRFPGPQRSIVADIGGGSLELVGAAYGGVRMSHSLPLGAVRLTELGLPLGQLRDHISQFLRNAIPAEWRDSRIIGSGGTFATLGSIILARRGLEGQPVHGVTVTTAEVTLLLETLAALSPDQRRNTPGLKPQRADIIVAGFAVIVELLNQVGAAEVTVSGFGVRDGLLLEMLGVV